MGRRTRRPAARCGSGPIARTIAELGDQLSLAADELWVGRPLGLHSTAAGKVFLAYGVATLPDGHLDAWTSAALGLTIGQR